ncbi:MAG TPA: efflux RND transporter periplasmic adaptor subunit [Bryobacteraceae bacterium]|nr:efflux RND transporter periplasmic adaptor subunit [Bryobacteraceae bacterium]
MSALRKRYNSGGWAGILLLAGWLLPAAGLFNLTGCGTSAKVRAGSIPAAVNVGVTRLGTKTLERKLTVSSELVPFQEVDVYAKESGYVRDLLVDYGTRVKKGQVMAVLEIPELEVQLRQDAAAITSASDQVTHAEHELSRIEAQHRVLHLQFARLNSVAQAKPGLVAQQEVDDAQGKDLAAEAQVEAAKSNLEVAQSQLQAAQAKKEHDTVLFAYSKITAPFTGVVTQRYANLGTLLQAGTNSSTQAMPLVRVSQDDLFRLVIPVPESYVRYIRVGDSVMVNVPSLNRAFPGKVTRFSVDVKEDTRTMHTEVDVLNPEHVLLPGLYAEATITIQRRPDAVAVPLQAISHEGNQASVYIVDPQDRIEERKVVLGVQTSTDAEALSGLHEGDRVVVSDRSGLKVGEQVHPQIVDLIQYQENKEE